MIEKLHKFLMKKYNNTKTKGKFVAYFIEEQLWFVMEEKLLLVLLLKNKSFKKTSN